MSCRVVTATPGKQRTCGGLICLLLGGWRLLDRVNQTRRDRSQTSSRRHEGKTHRHGLLVSSCVGIAPCKLHPFSFPLNFPVADGKAMVRLGSGLSTTRVLCLPVPVSQIWDQRTRGTLCMWVRLLGPSRHPAFPCSHPRGHRLNPRCCHPLLTPPCSRQHGPAPLRDL